MSPLLRPPPVLFSLFPSEGSVLSRIGSARRGCGSDGLARGGIVASGPGSGRFPSPGLSNTGTLSHGWDSRGVKASAPPFGH